MAAGDPDVDELRKTVRYDPATGEFFALRSIGSVAAGARLASTNSLGYLRFKFQGRSVSLHRLAVAMSSGEWPDELVDHINGNKADNRLENLRVVDRAQSQMNRRTPRNNSSWHRGVSWDSTARKWIARCAAYGRRRHLGLFEDFEAAVAAYRNAAKVMHGEFAREGV